jgi:AraC-like DNA-binding protein
MEHSPAAIYREYEPCEALRPFVRAFFTFAPATARESPRRATREVLFGQSDSYCSPMFADGHGSLVCSLGRACRDGVWRPAAGRLHSEIIGPITAARDTTPGERAEMAGVYFRAAALSRFADVPAAELTDHVVRLEDVWGKTAGELVGRLMDGAGIEFMEAALLRRLKPGAPAAIDVPGLAAWVLRRRGQVTVGELAAAAGISRQHLARVFRERTGVSPKIYCRLARFHAALSYAGRGRAGWAGAAATLGYADQSHMIADFREFSTLTPHLLASGGWFHPFIKRALGQP